MIRLIETIVIKINRSCLLTVQGSTIEIYNKLCLIDPVTILVMCQLWFEFVHSLNRLLYSYRDLKIILFDSIISPVDKTIVTKCLQFVSFSIEY